MGATLRSFVVSLLAAGFVLEITGASVADAAPPRPQVEMLDDASLADVFFLDPDRGWAVGDRGAIWHTDDGGRHWRLQDSPVGCRLHSVCFLDGENGWAAGGWTRPYTHKSSGVVLRTLDGGQTWRQLPTAAVPTLRRICMIDPRSGWAVGAASPLYPSAVYKTEDGGRGWAPIGGHRPEGWFAGDFRDRSGGLIAGAGEAALAGTNRFQAAASPLAPGDVVRAVRLGEANLAWLAGDAGLVLHSQNGGAAWSPPPAWPAESLSCFDFAALAARGRHVWIAGSPGTRVFHSADDGATWEQWSTDQPLPLRSLFFLDENHGWAVGDLGTILVTRDGGRSWLRQRGPAARLAVLGLLGGPQHMPWELMVRLAGNEGYLSGVEYVTPQDEASALPSESPWEERVREAMLIAGGAAANGAAGVRAPGADRLEEYLVRKIRQWRPDVIVTEPGGPRSDDPLRRLVNQAMLEAVAAAEDRNCFPEHEAICGLSPWSVKKVYGVQPVGEPGSVSVISASLAPRMGGTLADGAAAARAILNNEFQNPPTKIELQLIVDRTSRAGARGDVMSGIVLPVGSEARRRLAEPTAGSLDLVARNAQKQGNIQQIVVRAAEQAGGAVIGQVEELTRDLPETAAGDVLFQLAERLRQQGRPELAAEMYQRLVQKSPQHEASEAALLRLIQHWASSESSAQEPRRAEFRRGVAGAVEPAAFSAPVKEEGAAAGPPPAIGAALQVRDSAVASSDADQSERDRQTLALGQVAARSYSALFAEPAVRFALAAAARRQKNPREAERFLAPFASRDVSDPWWRCAQGELWLMKPSGEPPKTLVRCTVARERPYLDGKLDDAAWQDAQPLEIAGRWTVAAAPGAAPDAVAQLARDNEYLYFAVRCRKAPGVDYAATEVPRSYDAPLDDRDRVTLLIDLDRDYATHYRLTVDHRGWTGETCLGNASWNPEWFVAADADEETWTVEAAIPFRELAGQAPSGREVWGVGLQHKLPAAALPAGITGVPQAASPEDFVLLLFE